MTLTLQSKDICMNYIYSQYCKSRRWLQHGGLSRSTPLSRERQKKARGKKEGKPTGLDTCRVGENSAMYTFNKKAGPIAWIYGFGKIIRPELYESQLLERLIIATSRDRGRIGFLTGRATVRQIVETGLKYPKKIKSRRYRYTPSQTRLRPLPDQYPGDAGSVGPYSRQTQQ